MIPRCGSAGTAGDFYRCEAHDDITEARHPSAAQLEVLDLLEWNPLHLPLMRLTLHDWRRVDSIAAALEAARTPIPAPRSSAEQTGARVS